MAKTYHDIDHQKIKGHVGTWYGIGQHTRDGKTYFLLEHETYGDAAAHLIVDEDMNVLVDDSYDSFLGDLDDYLMSLEEE